jgi:hypothetical protein
MFRIFWLRSGKKIHVSYSIWQNYILWKITVNLEQIDHRIALVEERMGHVHWVENHKNHLKFLPGLIFEAKKGMFLEIWDILID